MDNANDLKMLVGNKLLQEAVIGLKPNYGVVITCLGLGAVTMGTFGFVLWGSVGASSLGGVGGAVGGLAGAKLQENKENTNIS
jgi:hypothetical protein